MGTWQIIFEQLKKSFGGNFLWIVYLAALVYLFFFEKDKRKTLIYPVILIWVVVCNPVCYNLLWRHLRGNTWWRLFWLFMVPPVIAYALVSVITRTKKHGKQILGILAACAVIAGCGNWIYNNAYTSFAAAQDYYKLPQDVIAVSDWLLEQERPVKIVADWPFCVDVREYSNDIILMYGRDVEGYFVKADEDKMQVFTTLSSDHPDLAFVKKQMQAGGYRFLVKANDGLDEKLYQDAGFEKRETIGSYTIFEVK